MPIAERIRASALAVGYRLGGWPRRLAALLCLGLALLTAQHRRPHPVAKAAPVVVVTHDLAAGTVLRSADVELAQWVPSQIPVRSYRSVHQAVGVAIAAAMDRGEPVTSARIRGPGITVGQAPGLVAATVSIASSNVLALIRPGDRIDLVAAIPTDIPTVGTPSPASPMPSARVVASGVRVLAVLAARPQAGGDQPAGLVVAVNRPTALAIASVVDGSMTATVRAPP